MIEYSKPNSGCNGGLMDYALTLHNAKAIASESSYTCTARDGTYMTSFTNAISSDGVSRDKDATSFEHGAYQEAQIVRRGK